MNDIDLELSAVYRNLEHKTSLFGLTPIDLPLIFIPGNVVLLAGVFGGFSSLWGVLVAVAIAAALVALKWRKPDDHIERMIAVAFTPRRLSHKQRDVLLRPFPLDERGRPR